MRKRPLHQSNESFHNLQQDQRFHQSKEQCSPASPSKPSFDGEQSSKPPLHTLLPLSSLVRPSSSLTTLSSGYSEQGNSLLSNSSSCHSLRSRQRQRSPGRSHSTSSISPLTILLSNNKDQNDRTRSPFVPYHPRLEYAIAKIQKCNDHAIQKSLRYEYMQIKSKPYWNKVKPYLYKIWKFLKTIILELLSIRCTFICLCIIGIHTSSYVYFVKMPIWEYEEGWTQWEVGMQNSVSDLIPSLSPISYDAQTNNRWSSNLEQLEQFPYLNSKGSEASEYIVPIPDYELMGRVREKLAKRLRMHAIQSCQNLKQQNPQNDQSSKHSLPVIGITVANDTPDNRYLRRLLHTIDLKTVGSIVITWYDEQTEAQLLGKQSKGLSHEVIDETLKEFIIRRKFAEVSWGDNSAAGNTTNVDGDPTEKHIVQLADTKSLKWMSWMATSIQQFCIFDSESTQKMTASNLGCANELLILRFSTNLGCSSGVNNPLFTHPTAPHWLIANYDIAYPPEVLYAMGKELQKTIRQRPDLAVHTYGYIYGRGKLENPWSNFVMTSCAVANVGVWDENIFPAYYEDDDYRDRIRYILGEWNDVIGDPDIYADVPQQFMNDTHLIHYQTDRHVSVAHGPLAADTYLSGTHETMKKVQDEEKAEKERSYLESLRHWLTAKSEVPQNPFQYESHRWSLAKEVSNAEGFFRCKHGAIPDAGKHGEDPLRYFGWHERFLLPFVNKTRVTRLRKFMSPPDETSANGFESIANDDASNPSPWAAWNFNATRRRCVHKAVNTLVSMPQSKERTNLTEEFKASCSVC